MTLVAAADAVPLVITVPVAALIGLVLGSFIATLVLRWGAGASILGRSHCDGCGRPLGWAELVPLIGGLVARGRCRACGAVIDPLHWRVEVGGAAIGVAAVLAMPGAAGWCLALFGWMLLPLVLFDARHFWLPDALVAPLAVAGLVLAGPMLDTAIQDRLIGAVAGGATLALLRHGYRRLRGREGMGEGDPKLAAAIGAWLGWQALPIVLLIASAGGIIFALVMQKRDVAISDRHVPFGSFLGAAAWCAVPLAGLVIGG